MGKFWDWFCEPFSIFVPREYPLNPVEKPKIEVVSFSKQKKKVNLFRPGNFDEYIGQARAKDLLKHYIKGVRRMNKPLPHVLIHGNAGMGKTTLARLIAQEMDVKFIEFAPGQLQNLYEKGEKMGEIEGGMIFFDEIHELDRDSCEVLYPVMEDFTLMGQPVKPFTFVGATTEVGEILRTRRPFYDRFKIIIELEDYTIANLVTIASQYNEMMFPADILPPPLYEVLAKNCRGVPRGLIRLLEASIFFGGEVNKVLRNFSIIKNGYTDKDLKILKYLEENEKGVGLKGLVAYLNTSEANYEQEIEPYLLRNGVLTRTSRGRKITNRGIELIKELERR